MPLAHVVICAKRQCVTVIPRMAFLPTDRILSLLVTSACSPRIPTTAIAQATPRLAPVRVVANTLRGSKTDLPGFCSVVDTGIVHPIDNDFFLMSHAGLLGTVSRLRRALRS